MENNPNPKSRALALESLITSPGWPVYCSRFDAIVKEELEAKIFDSKTSPEEREKMVKAREFLVKDYTPGKMAERILGVARREAEFAEQKAKAGNATATG